MAVSKGFCRYEFIQWTTIDVERLMRSNAKDVLWATIDVERLMRSNAKDVFWTTIDLKCLMQSIITQ